jgi:membrane-associated phospholipid phosphatase
VIRLVSLWSRRAICFLASAAFAFGQSTASSPAADQDSTRPVAQQAAVPAQTSGTAALPDNPQPNHPQTADSERDASENRLLNLPRSVLHDQIGMWTSPAHIKLSDATWLVPLGGFTAALFATDSTTSRDLSTVPSTLNRYRHISDYGVYAMAGGAGGLYLLGLITNNQHQRESGLLSGEAAIDSLIVTEALSLATGRERPLIDNANGHFFKRGTSFPSDHAAAAWSIAAMLSHEYPSPFVKFLSFGAAGVISASRITAKQHFTSDVLVGAAIGYLTSEFVYRQHHDPSLTGGSWEVPAVRPERPSHWQAKNMGSPYVPLDSWVYPALERLTALGYISSGSADMRPWTRMECARQLEEAQDRIDEDEPGGIEASQLFGTLQQEFAPEIKRLGGGDNADLRLESTYTRSTEIAGKPLTDSYHFGQTIFNDFGRPEEHGFNNVSGASGWASDGPFVGYVRAEYQHSPGAPALPLAARQAITLADFSHDIIPQPWPVPPDTPTASISQAHLLDAYVAMNLSDWQISYGKQSVWWGPDEAGGMMLSDNADPLLMFRVNRVTPFKLPSVFSILGPMRVEFFLGQYSGYQFMFTPEGLVGQYGQSLHPQPIVHGERFSFKPTPNFEFGMSRTTDYGGPGYPLTVHTFLRSVFSTDQTIPGAADKPGSRRSGLDFSYRIKNAMMFYADGFTEHDTISPIVGPDVAAWLGGIYLPKLPGLPKMDFRAEGMYTDPPIGGNVGSGFFYYNPTWVSGFTNAGHLMGDWVGREGQGVQVWTSYWFTPRNKLQFEVRHLKVSHEFITNGGTLADASARLDLWARSSFSLSALVQYETWNFPVLASTKQSNVTSSVQLSFWPRHHSKGSDQGSE